MAKPLDADWSNESITDLKLNQTTYGQGTSFPSSWPTERVFWRTDTNILYKNTNTIGSPVWTALNPFEEVDSYPTPVVDKKIYHTLVGANMVCTGIDNTTEREIWKTGDTEMFFRDSFLKYGSQAEFDSIYTPESTDIDGNITNDNIDWSTQLGANVTKVLISDLGKPLPNKFLVRFQLDVDTVTQNGDTLDDNFWIGLTSGLIEGGAAQSIPTEMGGSGSPFNYLLLGGIVDSTKKSWKAMQDSNVTAFGQPATSGTGFTTVISTGSKYIQITGEDGTFIIGIYPTSAYGTPTEEKTLSDSAGIVNSLRYFIIACGKQTTANHALIGTVDFLEVYRGISDKLDI